MKLNDAVFGAILLVLGLAVLAIVQGYPKIPGQNVGPALFPGLIAVGLLICSLILIVEGVKSRATAPWVQLLPWVRSRPHVIAFFAVIASVALYIVLVDRVGFLILSPLLLFALFVAFRTRPLPAAIVAVIVSVAIWYAFYKLLRVPLPWGVLQAFAF